MMAIMMGNMKTCQPAFNSLFFVIANWQITLLMSGRLKYPKEAKVIELNFVLLNFSSRFFPSFRYQTIFEFNEWKLIIEKHTVV